LFITQNGGMIIPFKNRMLQKWGFPGGPPSIIINIKEIKINRRTYNEKKISSK